MSEAIDTVPLAPIRSVVIASVETFPTRLFGLNVPEGVSHVPAI